MARWPDMPLLACEQNVSLEGVECRTARPEVWRVLEAVLGNGRNDF
jgi:hypothetical protein